jgi:plasmid maintenance system killer protein
MTSFFLLENNNSFVLENNTYLTFEDHIPEIVSVVAETPVRGKIKKKRMFTRQQAQPTYTINTEVITFNIPVFWTLATDIGIIIPTQKESKISKKLSIYNISQSITSLAVSVFNDIDTKLNSMQNNILSIPINTDYRLARAKSLSKLRVLVESI